MERPLYCLCLLIVVLCFAEANNPGFKARITTKGLKYANDVAIQALKKNVLKTHIPDQSGKASGFKYTVSDIHVTEFNPPSSDISLAAGQGLNWKAANAYIKVEGRFHYKKWFISAGGSFDAKISGVSFNLGINIGKDANGRPSISSRACSSSIGSVDFHFHGGMSWLYNLFRHKVGVMIKDLLNKQMCKLAVKAINEDAEKKLATLPVTTKLAKKFLLDYRLDKTPLFTTGYMETYHKGEVFWLTNPTTESPLVAPVMGKLPGAQDKMLYVWLSDYTFDTMGSVAQKHGLLVYNLTAKNLPPSNRVVLNTTCNEGMCIGKLMPQIGKKYPNAQVELRMTSGSSPAMKISTSGIAINCSGTIDIYARLPGKTETPFLFSLDAMMFTTANVSMHNELLYAKVDTLSLKLKPGKSVVGKIPVNVLNMLIDSALKVDFIPMLNKLGMRGIPLPVTGEIHFVGTKIVLVEDAVVIGTDLKYMAGRKLQEMEELETLRYIPRVRY